ncbi:MAG: DoxX family protein [Patescibacteria group bacterium]|nr:MAG: DoxX family protein [Patescibacteria group bacterium]
MHSPFMMHLRKPCNTDWAKLILRVAVGAVFVYHGKMKLFGGLAMTTGFFDKIGVPMPGIMAPFIGGVEFFGGLLLILGFAVRPIAFLHAATMVVAILAAKGLSSWAKIELEVVLLAASVNLLLSGAGAYAIDAWMMKKGSGEHDASMPMAPKA